MRRKEKLWLERHAQPAPKDWFNSRIGEREAQNQDYLERKWRRGGWASFEPIRQATWWAGSWKEFKPLVEETVALIGGDEEKSYLMINLIGKAAANGWMRRLIKQVGGRTGWKHCDWMGHWFNFALEATLKQRLYFFDDGRLLRWIEKGRFDHRLESLVAVVRANPHEIGFTGLVAKRLEAVRKNPATFLPSDLMEEML